MAEPFQIAAVHTSDRGTYKYCRRLWGWTSGLKGNYALVQPVSYFWLGSGFHYAMEDYHGLNYYGHPAEGMKAYAKACKVAGGQRLPDTWKEDLEMAVGMCEYYADYWLKTRDPFKTLWINGVPQVEVAFEVPLPFPEDKLRDFGWDQVVYRGRLDRVVEDEDGFLWVLDYKTARAFSTTHLPTDAQVTAYCWIGQVLYDRPFKGMIYQQHIKKVAGPPRLLANGTFSTNKAQVTSYPLYREALTNLYGDPNKAPQPNIDVLNMFGEKESDSQDAFIRRDIATRNSHQLEAEGVKVLLEIDEMLNPETPLYPHPNRMCSGCQFLQPCLMIDDGGDWEGWIKDNTISRSESEDPWRKHLQLPEPDQQISLSQEG